VYRSSGRIVILLAILLFGSNCACASFHQAEETEYAAAFSVPARPLKMIRSDASPLSAPSFLKRSRPIVVENAPAGIDILSRHCILLI
jgi:hypothetical protein